MLDRKLTEVRSLASALLKRRSKIPVETQLQHEEKIKLYYGVDAVSEELIYECANLNKFGTVNEIFIQHADLIYDNVCRNGEPAAIETFVITWRKWFISDVEPKHMPAGWEIEAKVTCETVDALK